MSVINTNSGVSAVAPWTVSATPIIQSGTAADSVAPGSTTSSLTVTLSALQTGLTFFMCGRAGTNTTTAPPAGYTEIAELGFTDGVGNLASLTGDIDYVTTPPASSATVGPATHTTSTTESRAALAFELVPSGWINQMVSGIEVH
jgi:hypothetical protein